jgi:GNAT superfamily N-acetyltransferase
MVKEIEFMENINYKELKIADLNDNLLDHYNRYQEVKRCYRKENGNWIIKNIEFVENWDKDKKIKVIQKLYETINSCGGYVFGAFIDEKLIGFAILFNKKFGSRKQYIQLDSMQVSYSNRHNGIGKYLFNLCVLKTKEIGIEKMYISANSSEETQRFYLGIGCKDAEEIDKELFEQEPYDRHMEYVV